MPPSRRRERTKHELRCFCSRRPLLAVYGVDEKGRLYIHQRVYKQNRVFGETVFYGGTVALLCRECLRWQQVTIQDRSRATLIPIDEPQVLSRESDTLPSLPTPQPEG